MNEPTKPKGNRGTKIEPIKNNSLWKQLSMIKCPKLPNIPPSGYLEILDISMGWFWAPAQYFSHIDGVEEVILGYAGGKANFPTFNDKKDHKETIRIIFDPSVVSCEEILEHFLEQGGLSTRNNCGEKYHPIIFLHLNRKIELKIHLFYLLKTILNQYVIKIIFIYSFIFRL